MEKLDLCDRALRLISAPKAPPPVFGSKAKLAAATCKPVVDIPRSPKTPPSPAAAAPPTTKLVPYSETESEGEFLQYWQK